MSPLLFQQLLRLYPAVARLAYTAKLAKGKKGAKGANVEVGKVDEFLELDGWRYGDLPVLLEERRRDGKGKEGAAWRLEKSELEKLVGWKLWVCFFFAGP